ncbi:hypothetical protein RND81_13G091600 [Saponaria officinalis]|uniref:Uncharacterized protein n=1 Tax=Saponaria officinalis TaxID=3572 RepID=A0AAW1H5A2_SAPOF
MTEYPSQNKKTRFRQIFRHKTKKINFCDGYSVTNIISLYNKQAARSRKPIFSFTLFNYPKIDFYPNPNTQNPTSPPSQLHRRPPQHRRPAALYLHRFFLLFSFSSFIFFIFLFFFLLRPLSLPPLLPPPPPMVAAASSIIIYY